MEWICGPLLFRSADEPMPAGAEVPFHAHDFPHATLIIAGEFDVTVGDAQPRRMLAGETVAVPAHAEHTLIARRDGSQYVCCWPHRNWQGEIVDTYVGNITSTH